MKDRIDWDKLKVIVDSSPIDLDGSSPNSEKINIWCMLLDIKDQQNRIEKNQKDLLQALQNLR